MTIIDIKPLFNDYTVTILAYENKFILEPKIMIKDK